MKPNKILIGASLVMFITCLVSFTVQNYTLKKSTGEVNQLQGLYIYVDSKPVLEYEYLGTVKGSGMSMGSGQYTDVRDNLIKRAKKEYPNGEAVIFSFIDGGTDRCDVIRFK